LIIDDKAAIRNLLERVFTKAGFEVRTAANTKEALDMLADEVFDAVTTDIQRQGSKEGIGLLKTAREK